jgi:hypothetical protein
MAKAPLQNITIVATFLSPGVTVGGSGFAIVGGKIVKIGPRGPAFKQLAEISAGLVAGKSGRSKRASR